MVSGQAFSPDGSILALSRWQHKEIDLWDVTTRRKIATLKDASGISFNAGGAATLALNGTECTIKLWDTATGMTKGTLRGHVGAIRRASLSPDGTLLASVSEDKTIKLWEVPTRSGIDGSDAGAYREKATLRGHTREVSSMSFSPDGTTLASGGGMDTTVKLWDVASGQEKATLKIPNTVCDVRFSPDGRTLACAFADGIELRDSVTGSVKATLKANPSYIGHCLSFSPDGATLALAHEVMGGTIKIWDVATGREKATLRGFLNMVSSPLFSPDGVTLAVTSGLRLLHSDVQQQVVTLLTSDQPLATTKATRWTGCALDGSEVTCLPLGEFRRQALRPASAVASASVGGSSVALDLALRMRWGTFNPNRWISDARKGEAKARHHLGVIHERARDYEEARRCHRQCVELASQAQHEWARRSRRRLSLIPWLQAWFPFHERARNSFESGDYRGGLREYQGADSLSGEDREQLGGRLAVILSRLVEEHCRAKEYASAERACTALAELSSANAGKGHARSGLREAKERLVSTLVKLAREGSAKKDYDSAERLYRLSIELDPAETSAHYGLGLALSAQGDDDGAIQQFRRAIEVEADYGPPHYALARRLEKEGEYDEAVGHWQTYVSLVKGGDRWGRSAVRSCARLLVRSGRQDEALQELRDWVEKDTQDRAARAELASLLCSLGRYKESGQVLEPLLSAKKPGPKALLVAALCSQEMGEAGEASNYVRMAAGKAPRAWQTKAAIADLLDLGVELRKPLEDLLHSDDALRPTFGASLALGYTVLASRLAGRDDKTGAAQACSVALKLAPDRADVQRSAGWVYRKLGMYEDGVRCYLKAAELEPERGANHGNLGRALYLAGRYDDAMAASLRALELDPKLPYVHSNVGLLHMLKRDLERALPSYAKALELKPTAIQRRAIDELSDLVEKQPEIAEAHYALGFCYEKKGGKAEAREHYQKYVDAAKEGKFVGSARQRMKALAPD